VRFAAASTETPRTAEEKKKELFDQRAREREARLAALRNFGQQKKEEAIKEKEELEKEAEERKQRSLNLSFSFFSAVAGADCVPVVFARTG
jgi:predicted Holliday junction resolvase-like endonuclease